ncbi:MAG TPA: response regulator [Pirellulales bacterium]|nr:response regulator [Pirellulales bacterium]
MNSVPLRVLVVEDYPDTADFMAKWVELAGHSARICHTGVEALDVAPAYRPDIILLDIGLPDMHGWNVARLLREDPALGETLIVAVTAYKTEDDRRRSEKIGIDIHLGKPVLQSDIAQILAQRT